MYHLQCSTCSHSGICTIQKDIDKVQENGPIKGILINCLRYEMMEGYNRTDLSERCAKEMMKGPELKAYIQKLDEMTAYVIYTECHDVDSEQNHEKGDQILLETLETLGLNKTIDAFRKVKKYYA